MNDDHGLNPFPATDAADVNEAAVQEWTASTTAFERVQAVLRRTTDWQTPNDIAERARVSTPTARKHLSALVKSEHATVMDVGDGKRYRRNPDQRRFERIQELADQHSRGELEGEIRQMKDRLRTFEDRYGVSSPESLVEVLDSDDDSGWNDLSRWKTTRRNLTFAKTALSFKETRDIDAMSIGEREMNA